MNAVRRLAAAMAIGVALGAHAQAQTTPAAGGETIQIGLSTDLIEVTADFSGADLTIFGSIENLDPLMARQNRYDVIVVLEGPSAPVVVRRKGRVFGMWINTRALTFDNVSESYSVSTTRPAQDITDPQNYQRLSLGAGNLYYEPADKSESVAAITEFTDALRSLKISTGAYTERIGGVQFLSQGLFRASLALPANVPIGAHKARAFLFRNGAFVKESSAPLQIGKAGLEQTIFRFAHDHGFFYGLLAVALAVATGWLGRIVFSRD